MRIHPDSVAFDNSWFFRYLQIGDAELRSVGDILFISHINFFGYFIGVLAEDKPGLHWQVVHLGDPHPLHDGYFLDHYKGQAPIWAYRDPELDDYDLDN